MTVSDMTRRKTTVKTERAELPRRPIALKLAPIVKGALTFVPGMGKLLPERGGETRSATYCYGVWLKHLALLWKHGMRSIPDSLAELGPGDSLGTGLAAMLCGVNHYRALDVVKHANTETNLQLFDQLVELFRQRKPRPVKGWPDFDDLLDAQLFPSQVLPPEWLQKTLAPERLARIRAAIASPDLARPDVSIEYIAPWFDEHAVQHESVELILSHAVLGEVVELEDTYRALHAWLKPGGWMSHQIAFEFDGLNGVWNGYWACPEPLWNLFRGKRPFVINRQPRSTHLGLLRQTGFNVVCALEDHNYHGVQRHQLSPGYRHLSDDDLYCSGLFVLASK